MPPGLQTLSSGLRHPNHCVSSRDCASHSQALFLAWASFLHTQSVLPGQILSDSSADLGSLSLSLSSASLLVICLENSTCLGQYLPSHSPRLQGMVGLAGLIHSARIPLATISARCLLSWLSRRLGQLRAGAARAAGSLWPPGVRLAQELPRPPPSASPLRHLPVSAPTSGPARWCPVRSAVLQTPAFHKHRKQKFPFCCC